MVISRLGCNFWLHGPNDLKFPSKFNLSQSNKCQTDYWRIYGPEFEFTIWSANYHVYHWSRKLLQMVWNKNTYKSVKFHWYSYKGSQDTCIFVILTQFSFQSVKCKNIWKKYIYILDSLLILFLINNSFQKCIRLALNKNNSKTKTIQNILFTELNISKHIHVF